MYPFQYHRATSVADAIDAMDAVDDGKFLAGGQTLLASLKLRLARPDRLVDIGGIPELRGVFMDGDHIRIGAMTRHADVAASRHLAEAIPALARLAGGIGDPMVRHRGTLGGSIANADPAADYPAAVLGLGATVITSRRRIAGDAFFRGLFETALAPGEMITAVEFPVPRRAAYVKFRHPASRFALVGVFVADTAAGPRVAVTGAAASVFRLEAFESELARNFTVGALADLSVDPGEFNSDLHASAEYRAQLVGVIARRAVAAALA
ncbi:xanthine dehydrogenase family protein subunit M [Ramlibacter sp. AW1]|uniref:Xanthine dehydrogenase family protein subunit M n=1 Tax=Ramlibacter aurantiacus TaxID=2801330 RepID=A0A936ZVH4_9BURK|nr:xanthine dehydrogenase family protein subunit M [Ramlibacter aurantiacus]MBL0423356.1 xanthine dehydrogenase family protein subunit M [Ramlibacter aurantiacus]